MRKTVLVKTPVLLLGLALYTLAVSLLLSALIKQQEVCQTQQRYVAIRTAACIRELDACYGALPRAPHRRRIAPDS